jgi:hypothetical protein
VEADLAIGLAPDKADRQSSAQFTARRLVANAAVEAGPQHMQLGFAHGALRTRDILPSNSRLKSLSSIRITRIPANASRLCVISFTPALRTSSSNCPVATGCCCRRG